jgi:hypothetical protein
MPRRREWVACLVVTVIALATHTACTSWLGPRDPIALAANHHLVATGLVVVSLLGARVGVMVVRVVSARISWPPRKEE